MYRFHASSGILLLALLLVSCAAPVQLTPTPIPTVVSAAVAGAASGLRTCIFVPGQSKAAVIPPEALTPQPIPTPTLVKIQTSQVSADVTSAQLDLYHQLRKQVEQSYADPNFNGKDWEAIGRKYEAMINAGLSESDFQPAMQQMLNELDDGYSSLQDTSITTGVSDTGAYAGLGMMTDNFTIPGVWFVLQVYKDSPAEKAGIKPHDTILAVNNGPVADAAGNPRTRAPKGTSLTVRIKSPGQAPRDVTATTDIINATTQDVDACLLSGTHIVYLRLPADFTQAGPGGVMKVLEATKPLGPLDGLIVDTRGVNTDGFYEPGMISHLSLFMSSKLGSYIMRQKPPDTMKVDLPLDINGSQTVPLIVLADETSSFSGGFYGKILQQAGRARIVGQADHAQLQAEEKFILSSRYTLILVTDLFQPEGKEKFKIGDHLEPDLNVPARWDLFDDSNDPVLAKAVELLIK